MLVSLMTAALTIAVATPSLAVNLPRNSINSKQIKNKQVKTTDLAQGAVKRPDIAVGAVDGTNVLDGALSGFDIANDSLKGLQIEETSLDFNVLQVRLGGCPAGQAIRSVSALGQPTCVDIAGGGLDAPLGGDLTGSLPNPLIALGAVDTAKLADDAVTAAKVPSNELGGSDIDEGSLSGAAITGVDAATVDGSDASDFLGASASAGGDLGGTFGNLQLGNNVVGTDEVALNALGTADIDESNLSGSAITGVDAATVDGANASDFLGAAATAGGDLGGTFSDLQLGTGSVGTSEVDSSLTAADIADTNTLGSAEVNEANLTVIQGAGQVVRGTLNATGGTAAGTDVLSNVPGFGSSDIEFSACTPDAGALAIAALQLDNSSGTSVLTWEFGPISAIAGSTDVTSGAQEVLGSAVAGVLNADELLDIYLYRVDTGASARVTIGESTDASNCRFVVEAVTST